jgi:hypothetical protein
MHTSEASFSLLLLHFEIVDDFPGSKDPRMASSVCSSCQHTSDEQVFVESSHIRSYKKHALLLLMKLMHHS